MLSQPHLLSSKSITLVCGLCPAQLQGLTGRKGGEEKPNTEHTEKLGLGGLGPLMEKLHSPFIMCR